jgi:hypothetical protein
VSPALTLALLLPLTASLACKLGAGDEPTKDSPAQGQTGRVAPTAAPGGIPDIPDGRSSPPTLAEWEQGMQVNTVGPNSAPKNCTMKVVREWLKVNCSGNIENVSDLDGFGKEGVDFFQMVKPGQLADLVVRIHRGALKARINRSDHRASLFVSWPPSAPRPTIIALQHNPK